MSDAQEVLGKLFDTNTVMLEKLGREVKVKKVTLRTLKPILALIGKVVADLKLTADNLPSVNLQDPGLILKLISIYYDDAVKLIVLLADVTEEELLDMDPDESVLVIQSVIALNKDFFTKKVLPNLQLTGEILGAAKES